MGSHLPICFPRSARNPSIKLPEYYNQVIGRFILKGVDMKHITPIGQNNNTGPDANPLSFDCFLGITDICTYYDRADGCAAYDYCGYDLDDGSVCAVDHCGIDNT